jgi:hypothetical protein
MAQGGKVNYREHYKPETPIRERMAFSDLVLVWLSGVAVGVTLMLLVTGN